MNQTQEQSPKTGRSIRVKPHFIGSEITGYGAESAGRESQAGEADRWQAFGAWVRKRRRSLGISQETAAARAGIAGNHWSRIETGKSGIRYDKVEPIAHALELNATHVYRFSGYSPPDAARFTEPSAGRRYCIATRPAQGNENSGFRATSTIPKPMPASQQDIERIEACLFQIMESQRRHDEFVLKLMAVLKLATHLTEGKPAAVLKRLLNQHGSRAGLLKRIV